MRRYTMVLTACAMLAPSALFAQGAPSTKIDSRIRDTSHVSVRLVDGSTVYGRLQRLGADSVVVDGAAGRSAFAMAAVRELRDAGTPRGNVDGTTEYWFPNANTTRLFFGPTGRMLAEGEGYFADHMVFFGSVAYGVHDRVTVGGGALMAPESNLWFVTPKIGLVQSEKVNVAAGALFGGWGTEATGGIAFVAATLGGVNNSATFAVGNAFSGSNAERDKILMIGGERRMSRRVSFVTENYVFNGEDPLVSYGLRILGEKTSVDLAFFNMMGRNAVFPGIPYVAFVIRF